MITLTAEQELYVNTIAKRKQKPVESVLDELLTQGTFQNKKEMEDCTLELFAQWEQEDIERLARMTPEDIAAEDNRDAELLRFLETNRLALRVPDMSGDD